MSPRFRTLTTVTLAAAIAAALPARVGAETDRWIPAARDSATGVVVPLEALAAAPNPVGPAAIRTGTVVVGITIAIRSPLPATARPMCFATLTHWTNSGGTWQNYYQTDGVLSTRNGGQATCSVRLPFTWADVTPTNKIGLQVEVTSNINRLATTARPLARGVTIDLPPIDFPAAGGTKTVNLTTAL